MTTAMAANNIKAQRIADRNADIDSRIKEIIALDAHVKELQAKLKDMKINFAGEYFEEENAIAEVITGEEYEMKKIPVLTKKAYDTKALKVLVEAAGIEVKEIITKKMVTTVNEKALENAIKSGKLTKDMVDKTISGNMNYKMVPQHI